MDKAETRQSLVKDKAVETRQRTHGLGRNKKKIKRAKGRMMAEIKQERGSSLQGNA